MKRILKPARKIGGTIRLPGDKSIAHRAALFSILSRGPITIRNFPPERLNVDAATLIDCGNSGTTARLLSGILAGSSVEVTLTGDESLSKRPMKRVIDPLESMGAEIFADNNCLPLRIRGRQLSSLEYRLPVASAQVKSALLLAGLASSCSVVIREDTMRGSHREEYQGGGRG
jgi:3-phosphoshikimate 1-carboxyvinyltransferase